MEIKNFDQLVAKVDDRPRRTVVLAGAQDAHALEAVAEAHAKGKVDCLLVGRGGEIRETAERLRFRLEPDWLLEAEQDEETAARAVQAVMERDGAFLMKGGMMTGTLLKAVVNREFGMRGEGVISHIALLENPNYHKLVAVTDGGMITAPDFGQKRAIAQNAVAFFRNMGYDRPKLAFLAAVEVANPKMPETVDAARLAECFNASGACFAAGPLSLDLAISHESALIKNVSGPVIGEADVIVSPDMVSGNTLSKSMIYFGKALMAGVVVGARRPIVLSSRGASAKEKYLSLILAAACV